MSLLSGRPSQTVKFNIIGIKKLCLKYITCFSSSKQFMYPEHKVKIFKPIVFSLTEYRLSVTIFNFNCLKMHSDRCLMSGSKICLENSQNLFRKFPKVVFGTRSRQLDSIFDKLLSKYAQKFGKKIQISESNWQVCLKVWLESKKPWAFDCIKYFEGAKTGR